MCVCVYQEIETTNTSLKTITVGDMQEDKIYKKDPRKPQDSIFNKLATSVLTSGPRHHQPNTEYDVQERPHYLQVITIL